MADIEFLYDAGRTCVATLRRAADDHFWSTAAGAFERFASANAADYGLPATEDPASVYGVDMPAAADAGTYYADLYDAASLTASQIVADAWVKRKTFTWNGTAVADDSGEPDAGPLTGYTTRDAVRKRLTDAGWIWTADRNGSGTVSEQEIADAVDTAMEYADNLIDGAVSGILTPAEARALGNAWLRDRATDIAAFRATTHGGRRTPKVIRDDYERALAWLEEVAAGTRTVPGLSGSGPQRFRGGVTAVQVTTDEARAERYYPRRGGRSCWPY